MSPICFDANQLHAAVRALPKDSPPFARVAEIASLQHGAISRDQLEHLELTPAWILHQLNRGALHAVGEGLYAVGHRGLSRRGRAVVALLRAGEGSALSHESAARMWGILPASNTGPIHVSLARRRGLPHVDGVKVHRPRALPESAVVEHRGLPVTTPERTVRDRLAASSVVEITRMLEQMVTTLGRSPDELHAWGRGLGPVAGRQRLWLALDHVVGPAVLRSELEAAFRSLCQSAGLPMPQTNVRVGRWEVDVVWRDLMVAVELDSWRWHGGRWSFYRDRDKGLALSRAGYELLRVTWPQVKHRETDVVETLAIVLGRAASRR